MYTHRKVYGHVAKAVGCRALIVNYGRAPENAHPGPVNDMATAYRWLLDQGITPKHIALTGDSAGGGLAVTTMLRVREQGLPLPAATMPLSPWLDMDATGASFETNKERDVLVTREIIQGMSATFLGENGNRKRSAGESAASPTCAVCRRSISRSADTRRCWTTATLWPRRCARRTGR